MCSLWGTDKATELRWVEFETKDRTIEYVQNCDSYINIPLSQAYKSEENTSNLVGRKKNL
jgi:hypothetical protein